MGKHYSIRRILPPADRSEELPKYVKGQAAEDFYTKPRYLWCGTFAETEDQSVADYLAALNAEHGHEHCAQECDNQPDQD